MVEGVKIGERAPGPVERLAIALMLATASMVGGLASAITAHFLGLAQGADRAHFAALFLGGFGGGAFVVRFVPRERFSSSCPSSAHLLLAAAASFCAAIGLAVMTAPWQELMSEPGATPLMVIKDLTSTCAPLSAALLAPWLVLSVRRNR